MHGLLVICLIYFQNYKGKVIIGNNTNIIKHWINNLQHIFLAVAAKELILCVLLVDPEI